MSWQRARSPEQKAERIDAILDAAGALFDRSPLHEISMTSLAEEAGMGKASLYSYFGTKEEVFLSLFRQEGDAWILHQEQALSRLRTPDAAKVARCIAKVSVGHKRLCYLATLLHAILEENTPCEALLEFKLDMREPLFRFAAAVQKALPELSARDAQTLFIQHHALLVGLWPFANPGMNAASALEDVRLKDFHIEFQSVFESSLRAIIEAAAKH
jgi:AcrR family transcriptional regulator